MKRNMPAPTMGRTVQALRSTFIGTMVGRLANAYPVALRPVVAPTYVVAPIVDVPVHN